MAKAEGLRWLKKGQEHLWLAEIAVREGVYSLSCFHSQQAAEDALKGFLIAHTGVHMLTHSLARLATRLMRRRSFGCQEMMN